MPFLEVECDSGFAIAVGIHLALSISCIFARE